MEVKLKRLLIAGMMCLFLSGCKKGAEAPNAASAPKPPQSAVVPAPSEKTTPQSVDPQARIDQLKKELCEECGPESECDVMDLYEFPSNGKTPKRLIAFSSPGGGPNSSFTVMLSTKDACTPVLQESGTSINFVPKPDKNQFPDIGVTSHWSVEESVETGYHWERQQYVSEGSIKTNTRTGTEEVLH